MPLLHQLVAVLALGALAGCAPFAVSPRAGDSPIRPLRLGDANAYLVVPSHPGGSPILVDTGYEGPRERSVIASALATEGYGWEDLALVILTHGHGDHAGNTAWISRTHGIPIVAGDGDAQALGAGENGAFDVIGPEAALVSLLVDHRFPPVSPAHLLRTAPGETSWSLHPYGISGEVVLVGGHTQGSLVILLNTGDALVGDLLRGGWLGGRLARGRPLTHYFHEDRARARAVVGALLQRGVRRFHLGHGGPVSAERVADWLR